MAKLIDTPGVSELIETSVAKALKKQSADFNRSIKSASKAAIDAAKEAGEKAHVALIKDVTADILGAVNASV